jgi:hypothetical protein
MLADKSLLGVCSVRLVHVTRKYYDIPAMMWQVRFIDSFLSEFPSEQFEIQPRFVEMPMEFRVI